MEKLLVVDDEINILNVIESYLIKEGFEVYLAKDGEKALEVFKKYEIDLVVLDLMLPKYSGEEVCTKIREISDVPIIMLTAKNQLEDTINGFNLGADDYINKPFATTELVARIKAILKRVDTNQTKKLLSFRNNDLIINKEDFSVKKKGLNIEITPNEFLVLLTLVQNENKVLSREQLISKTFNSEYDGFDRIIDVYIKNIRKKIEDDTKHPIYIKTIYGVGYKFDGDINGFN